MVGGMLGRTYMVIPFISVSNNIVLQMKNDSKRFKQILILLNKKLP